MPSKTAKCRVGVGGFARTFGVRGKGGRERGERRKG